MASRAQGAAIGAPIAIGEQLLSDLAGAIQDRDRQLWNPLAIELDAGLEHDFELDWGVVDLENSADAVAIGAHIAHKLRSCPEQGAED